MNTTDNNLLDKRTTDKLFYKGKYIFSEEINSELNIAICKDMTTAKRLVHACNSYEIVDLFPDNPKLPISHQVLDIAKAAIQKASQL